MDLSEIVDSHMDVHAPGAIGGSMMPGDAQPPASGMSALPAAGAAAGGASPLTVVSKALGAAGNVLAPGLAPRFAPPASPPMPASPVAPPLLQSPTAGAPVAGPLPAMAMSDRRAKFGILPGDDDLDEILDSVYANLTARRR